MGLLTFAINVTLDGCCDHREMIADDAMLRYYTRLMDEAGGMLWGRTTCEMMESAWPAVARDPKARPAFRTWARKLEAKPKHVVSTTRRGRGLHAARSRSFSASGQRLARCSSGFSILKFCVVPVAARE